MKIKLTTLFFLTIIAMSCFSQNKSSIISGKISSFDKKLSEVHILNLRTRLGAVSNDLGMFKIAAAVNDTLLCSSIQYQRVKLVITKTHFKQKEIVIHLMPSINLLDEMTLHQLSGSLNSDIKKTPKASVPKFTFSFDKSILSHPFASDKMERSKPPNPQKFTDPIQMNGVGGAVGFRNYALEAEQRLKRQLNNKKQFPVSIRKKFGLSFFTDNLNIPEEKINHFLSYCEDKDILKKFNDNQLLEVIEILRKESIHYHNAQK